MQITDTILMIRPAAFAFNEETAATNYFQKQPFLSADELQKLAIMQFDAMADNLRFHGIDVIIIEDTPEPPKPDAIFPNNWISTNGEGVVSVFPMQSRSRRLEKRSDVVELLSQKFIISEVEDWSPYEKEEQFLEGTGSMVLDHQHKIIYACLSPRTHQAMVEKFAEAHGYRAITFQAHDENGKEIYHTNVMMCIGEGFAVLCPKAITDHNERVAVTQLLEATGHENIYITFEQMNAFAGNMLQLKNRADERLIVLSQTAFNSLEEDKKGKLQQNGKLLPVDVSIIEQAEGGSVRCMIAEIFLQPRQE